MRRWAGYSPPSSTPPKARSPCSFRLEAVSILDGDGELFCDRDADRAFGDALKANLDEGILVREVDHNINDPAFAAAATALLLELIAEKEGE